GTLVHTEFGRRVRVLDLPGIGQKGVEHSWGDPPLYYGAAKSVRTDVVLLDRFDKPIAIYDLKTGNAKLTTKRIQELRDKVGGLKIPIIELRYGDATALQR